MCGFTSAIVGALISDKYEKKGYYRTKSYVCICAGALGIPTIMCSTLFQNNFWFSMSMLAIEYLFAESWMSPSITMVINSISPENKGFASSAYIFMATIAGTISTLLLGLLANWFDAKDNKGVYG